MCSFDDNKSLKIAEFRLQGKAPTWVESPEENKTKLYILEELRNAIFKDFVPQNEKTKTRAKLMSLKMNARV